MRSTNGAFTMKKYSILITMLIISYCNASKNTIDVPFIAKNTSETLDTKSCSVTIESLWKELENPIKKTVNDDKLIAVGKITFKNKAKEVIKLDELTLNWHGAPVHYVLGSLYKANANDSFLPIDAFLVCDSSWNKVDQMLTLKFNKSESLGSCTTFYMVLTIPHNLEPMLKNGYFQIATTNLPAQFRTYAHHHAPLRIAMH